MMANNWQRLNIVLNMSNRFDYEEFKQRCVEEGCLTLDAAEFAQKVGVLSCAITKYPDKSPNEAYLQLTAETNSTKSGQIPIDFSVLFSKLTTEQQEEIKKNSKSTSGCGTCGGGKVR